MMHFFLGRTRRNSKESGRTASGVIEISSRQTAQNHKNVIYMEAYGGCNV